MWPILPGEVFALTAAAAWILSTLVINHGLEHMQEEDRQARMGLGLVVSLVTGSALLSLVMLPHLALADFTLFIVLAGVFTFPLGTGFYYFASEAYGENSEIASQFIKVKPIFSAGVGVVLGETLTTGLSLSLLAVAIGFVLLVTGTHRSGFSHGAAIVGVLAALSWSAGEGFMKIGLVGDSSLMATFVAITTGTLVYLVLAVPVLASRLDLQEELRQPWVRGFVGHGILSFGIAYSAFFTAIKQIGLSRTALITAFWPAAAILLGYGIDMVRGEDTSKRDEIRHFLPAAGFLLLGSVLALL